MKAKFQKYSWRVWAVIAAAVVVQLILFNYKDLLHVDEIFSFGLANGNNGPYMRYSIDDFRNHLFVQDDFKEYLLLQHSTFADMWQHLKLDNHMPMYFVMLRLFSLPFASEFSLLPGIFLNVLLLCVFLFGAYRLFLILFKDEDIALGGLLLTAFCLPVLSMAVFIRMYLLWMVFCIYLTHAVVVYLDNEKVEKKNLLAITVFSLLQILTHFYGFIFGFVLTAGASVVLLLKKEYRKIFILAGFMLLSVLLSGLIFPAMIGIGLHGERGAQFFMKLSDYVAFFTKVFGEQIPFFTQVFFGNWVVTVVSFALFIITVCFGLKKKVMSGDEKHQLLFFSLIFIGYGCVSSLFQPNMGVWQVRYFAPIFVIAIGLFMYMLVIWQRLLRLYKICFLATFYLIAACCGVYSSQVDNAFWVKKDYQYKRMDNAVYGGNILWGLSREWMQVWTLHSFMEQLINVHRVWLITDVYDDTFVSFTNKLKEEHQYAYLVLPKTQENFPEGAVSWIKDMTNQEAFYLFTLKNDLASGAVFEASVFLVAPY